MDITRYMEKIDAKVANDKRRELDKQTELKRKFNRLAAEIDGLCFRIGDILTVAKYCEKNGIDVADKYASRDHGYGELKYSFVADGFYHHVGFYKRGERGKIDGLAIRNGGACGPWNFRVADDDEISFFWEHEDQTQYPGVTYDLPTERSIRDMEDFLKEFPAFEKAFYSFVDSLA